MPATRSSAQPRRAIAARRRGRARAAPRRWSPHAGTAVDARAVHRRRRPQRAPQHGVALAAVDVVVVEARRPARRRRPRPASRRRCRAATAARPRRPRRPLAEQLGGAPGLARAAPGRWRRARRRRPRAATVPAAGLERLARGGSKPSAHGTRDEAEVDRARRLVDRPLRRQRAPRARWRARCSAMPGIAPEREMSRTDWCEWPGPAGHEPGERADVDDLRALGGVVVDLLVGPRRRGSRRTSARPAAAPPSAIAAGLRHHVLLGDAALDEALGEARRGTAIRPVVQDEVGVERDEPRVAARPASTSASP